MKQIFSVLYFITVLSSAQTIQDCKGRFDSYLNFHGNLSSIVRFDKDGIYILNRQGAKETAIYTEETRMVADLLKHKTFAEQKEFLKLKKLKRYNQKERDSIFRTITDLKTIVGTSDKSPLSGYRIALDPGHFAVTFAEAASERKYLRMAANGDSIQLFESRLTFNTAQLLQQLLEAQGAQVFVTRPRENFTSFGCTYTQWLKDHRKRVLDSLKELKEMSPERQRKLLKMNAHDFFWSFFRDFELANRAEKINNFNPHLTAIIHYNVDEKNAPWKKLTNKNFTMAFIGGAFTASDLFKSETKPDFLRLLLTDQLNLSQRLAEETVLNFSKNLNIDIASPGDAIYLKNNCNTISSAGVFCRNLFLCRKINSPLVYGESLYQDNYKEAKELMKLNIEVNGIKTNQRVQKVAQSYFEAILKFPEMTQEKKQ